MLLFCVISVSPQKVKIKRVPEYFEVGEEYALACQVDGSRPPPKIKWFLNYQPYHKRPHKVYISRPPLLIFQLRMSKFNLALFHFQETLKDNNETKLSVLRFKPKREDNGKRIRCLAENTEMNTENARMEDSIRLSVSCMHVLEIF